MASTRLEDDEKDKMSKQHIGAHLDQPDEGESSDKELPEPIRPPRKMPSLPPIGISQVKDLLTKMPEQNIMRQVANNLTSGAYHSDDSGSEMAMLGLFDCILETTLHHNDDDDEENSPKEMPCGFCNKIFNSKMRLQTHILVLHSQEDPSLLNVTHGAPRRELQRSHSNSKTAGSEAIDAKARPFSQGLFNMDVSQAVDADLVKHLPPKQRVKLSPKTRLISRDQLELHQSKKNSDVPGDSTVSHPIPETNTAKGAAYSEGHSSTQGDAKDLSSTSTSLLSQKTDTEKSDTEEPRITRLRGRSGSRSLPESSLSSSSIHSPGPSGEKRRSSRHQDKSNEPVSSSLSAPKRKTRDIAPNLESKKLKISGGASEGDNKKSHSTRRNR
ncbi:hypothetical protein ElyMa_005591400 [Elysia marginata]|uniref:C2H2-type domain-containing protein n=1 Tax=Elysia marginata TaxID=1093978 RepID=A0AAV4F4Y5_9GAST|nr:hypothetical protein ElyMa_005591400 [Elysia marginata]